MKFLEIKSLKEAKKLLKDNFKLKPTYENIDIRDALGRVLGIDVTATVDVPPFDRSKMDGFAIMAEDIFSADESAPVKLKKLGEVAAGESKDLELKKGCAVGIATGAVVPHGANAVVMVEYTTELNKDLIEVIRPVVPGENITPSGSDISAGEIILKKNTILASRHLGMLAAQGIREINVFCLPKIALFSTGNELVSPGGSLDPGEVYDINSHSLAGRIVECGGSPYVFGVVEDQRGELKSMLKTTLESFDITVTSGGTSKGAGDLLAEVIDELGEPGVVVHGVNLKPGKPVIIGVVGEKLIFGLPGNPLSALIAFNVFVEGIIRSLSGLPKSWNSKVKAELAVRIHSPRGRHEFYFVHLIHGAHDNLKAYPVTKGSGAITAINEADGYVEITAGTEMIEKETTLDVVLLDEKSKIPEMTFIGSHCLGIEVISKLASFKMKTIYVGSSGGLSAVKKKECDIAGMHLLHDSGSYNLLFLDSSIALIKGYTREQGLMVKKGNPKGISGIESVLRTDVNFVNRNQGSGTRILLQNTLKSLNISEKKIANIRGEVKSHSAVAAAVAMGKADAGLGIQAAAENYGLDFIPVKKEEYDFAVPIELLDRKEIHELCTLLKSERFKKELEKLPGLRTSDETGNIINI